MALLANLKDYLDIIFIKSVIHLTFTAKGVHHDFAVVLIVDFYVISVCMLNSMLFHLSFSFHFFQIL